MYQYANVEKSGETVTGFTFPVAGYVKDRPGPKPGREGYSNGRGDIWALWQNGQGRPNPAIGKKVRVTWLRAWGGRPAGYTLEGILLNTFTPNGRVLLGEILRDDGRKESAPWSRNYLAVEVLEPIDWNAHEAAVQAWEAMHAEEGDDDGDYGEVC